KNVANRINNITFNTRFREKANKALNKCLEFASVIGAKVNCLYIKTSKSDISETTIQEWKTAYENHNIDFHIIESNEVNKPILEYIEKNQSDLLAILTYKRNFIEEMFRGSTAQKLSYYASVPVLVIHESDLYNLKKNILLIKKAVPKLERLLLYLNYSLLFNNFHCFTVSFNSYFYKVTSCRQRSHIDLSICSIYSFLNNGLT